MTLPAVMAGLTPKPVPIPIKAIPMVAAVVQELPQARETNAHKAQLVTRKIEGLMIFRP